MRAALLSILALIIAACGGNAGPTPTPTQAPTETATLVPTLVPTPTLIPTFVLDAEFFDSLPESTAEATPEFIFEPVEDEIIPAPISVTTPEGWTTQAGSSLFEDAFGLNLVPFTAYYGPVTGGTGYIIVVWGFGSIVKGNPLDTTAGEVNLGADGMRLLRLAVMFGCNIGHGLAFDTEFEVGGQVAYGSHFSAVDCPDRPDTRGWYATLIQHELNYAFYVYAEPIEAMDGTAGTELQAILDTVEFFPLEATQEADSDEDQP